MQDFLFCKYKCAKEDAKEDAKLCNGSFSFNEEKISNITKHAAMYIGSGYHSFIFDVREECKKVGI